MKWLMGFIVLLMLLCIVGFIYLFNNHCKPEPKPLPKFHVELPTLSLVTSLPSPVPTPTPDPWVVTAYTAGFESTGKTPSSKEYGVTASGSRVKIGDCACDRQYPFGTIFIVEGIGSFECTDRGGMVKGNHLDLYIPSLKQALKFGKQYLKVSTISESQFALRLTKTF